MWRWAVVALLLVGSSATGVAAAERLGPTPSPAERERLVRGDVVYRQGAVPRNGAPVPGARGAVAFVRTDTPPEPVWAILTAPRRYPEIFPGLRSVEVLEEAPATWLVRTNGKVGPFEFSYHTRHEVRAQTHTIQWRLDRTRDNDVFDDNWGWWQLHPDSGGTLVVYAFGSVPSSWQPLAGFFERRGVTQALQGLRSAARDTGQPGRPRGEVLPVRPHAAIARRLDLPAGRAGMPGGGTAPPVSVRARTGARSGPSTPDPGRAPAPPAGSGRD